MIWFSGPPAASNRRRRRQSLLDLFENHIYAAPKEGEWALRRSRKHSPTGRRDMGVGCQGVRQTRAAVGGGIAHQIHNKVLRGGAAAERPSWLRSQPPHQAAEEPPFFFWCPSPQGARAPQTSYAGGRDDHERHPSKTECLTQAKLQRP